MEKQEALFKYLLRLGDNALILGHRLSELCSWGPILEEDIATTNISLDLIGQAQSLLKQAGDVEGKGRTADDLAYKRAERDFYNALITEYPNGDFAVTMVRQFLYDTYEHFLYTALKESKDENLAAIAVKSHKEVAYHLRHTSQWVIRMGDGTEESKQRAQTALNDIWMFTEDLFATDESDEVLVKEGIAPDMATIKSQWEKHVKEVLTEATLTMPEEQWQQSGSKEGRHSEQLGFILAEMQYLPRAYPEASW